MRALQTEMVGALRMRLLQTSADVARVYLTSQHVEQPSLIVIGFLGHDRDHAQRQFDRYLDRARAQLEAEDDVA